MGNMGWGGATVRRQSGLTGADGAWDTEAVQRRLAELAQRRDELTPRFEQLAARLADARERLATGLPPDQDLDAQIAATRDAFMRLYADARAMAEALDVALAPPTGAPTLSDVTAVLGAIEAGLRAELARQASEAAARRGAALAVLDRVAGVTYRGPDNAEGFGALRSWQEQARTLHDEIAASELSPAHPDIPPLTDGTHRFNHLLDLIDGLPTLDEPDYRRLVNAVSADFDEALARAAGRGLLMADPA
jgi:hypothetical protein